MGSCGPDQGAFQRSGACPNRASGELRDGGDRQRCGCCANLCAAFADRPHSALRSGPTWKACARPRHRIAGPRMQTESLATLACHVAGRTTVARCAHARPIVADTVARARLALACQLETALRARPSRVACTPARVAAGTMATAATLGCAVLAVPTREAETRTEDASTVTGTTPRAELLAPLPLEALMADALVIHASAVSIAIPRATMPRVRS